MKGLQNIRRFTVKKVFAKTKNVKNFISLMNNLQNRPAGVPGMALVYGEPGLGKTNSILWWAARNDSILISVSSSSDIDLNEFVLNSEYLRIVDNETLDFQILDLFCKSFDASAFVKSGEDYTICIKFSSVSEPEEKLILSSEKSVYSKDRFSLYHIILSEKMGYNFFK